MPSMLSTLRSLPNLVYAAKSTRWNGPTRFAFHILALTLLLSITHFGVILGLGIRLLHLGTSTPCISKFGGVAGRRTDFPVALLNLDGGGGDLFDLGENSNKSMVVMACIVTPLLCIALLVTLLWGHCRKRGVSNRRAVLEGSGNLVMLILIPLQDAYLGPDKYQVPTNEQRNWCWKNGAEFEDMRREREVRRALGLASELLSGMAAVW
jgi:hypothetical protein